MVEAGYSRDLRSGARVAATAGEDRSPSGRVLLAARVAASGWNQAPRAPRRERPSRHVSLSPTAAMVTLLALLSGCASRAGAALAPQVGVPIPNITLPGGDPINWWLDSDAFNHPETMGFAISAPSLFPTIDTFFDPVSLSPGGDSRALFVPNALVTAGFQLHAYDRNPPHSDLDDHSLEPFGWGLVGDQDRVFVAGSQELEVFDVQNASDLRSQTIVPREFRVLHLDEARGLLFAGEGGGGSLNVFNVSVPGSLPTVGTLNITDFAEGTSSTMAWLDATRLLVCLRNEVVVVDAADPAAMGVISTFARFDDPVAVFVRNSTAFVLDRISNDVVAWDLANLTNPTERDRYGMSLTPTRGGAQSGDFLFALGDNRVDVVDISGPTIQEVDGRGLSSPSHMAVGGQMAVFVSSSGPTTVYRLFVPRIGGTVPMTPGDYPVTVTACASGNLCRVQTFYVKVPPSTGTTGSSTTGLPTTGLATTGSSSTGLPTTGLATTGMASTSGGSTGISTGASSSATTGMATGTKPGTTGIAPVADSETSSEEAGLGLVIGIVAGVAALIFSSLGGLFIARRRRREHETSYSHPPLDYSREAVYGGVAEVARRPEDPQYGSVAEVVRPPAGDDPQYGSVADVIEDDSYTPQYGTVADVEEI